MVNLSNLTLDTPVKVGDEIYKVIETNTEEFSYQIWKVYTRL